jgi:hypothetical protein
MLDPSVTNSILQTPSRILGSGVFPVEIATLSPMWLQFELFLIFAIELTKWQVDK